MDKDEEEGRERLEGMVVVIALALAVLKCILSNIPRVGAPRGLAAFPCPLFLILHACWKTHSTVRPLFLYIFSGWVTGIKCLASMNYRDIYLFVQRFQFWLQRADVGESQHVCLRWPLSKVQTKFIATDGRTTDPLQDPATLNVLPVKKARRRAGCAPQD